MKTDVRILFISMLAGIFLSPTLVQAAARYTDHADIRKHASQYLQDKATAMGLSNTKIELGSIDNRLKLAHCGSGIEVTSNNSRLPGHVSLAVRCNADKPWKIYLQATVHAYQQIYTARAQIKRGETLKATDLVKKKHDITKLNGNYITDIKDLQGHVARRHIRKGEIINPFAIVKSKLIKRGEQVTIIAETSGIKVRMTGKAMNDASAGEQVRVKSKNSKRIVEGIAVNRGIVKINM